MSAVFTSHRVSEQASEQASEFWPLAILNVSLSFTNKNDLDMIPKCVSKFLLDSMKILLNLLVAIPRYIFFIKSSHIYILVIFEFAHFCKNLKNGLIKVFDTFTAGC